MALGQAPVVFKHDGAPDAGAVQQMLQSGGHALLPGGRERRDATQAAEEAGWS
jgi:hypothetical protein